MREEINHRLAELFQLYADDALDANQAEELNELLREAPATRSEFVRCCVHARLLRETLAIEEMAEAESAELAPSPDLAGRGGLLAHPRALSFLVAALVIGLLITAMAFMGVPFYPTITRNDGNAPPSTPIVARLTAVRGVVVWEDEGNRPRAGAFLMAGHRLEFERGFVEITFNNGAIVVLNGRCRFEVKGLSAGSLERGSLAAFVNPSARGFAISTPFASIVDLGTEFGVQVDDRGAAEIVVLSGLVEVKKNEIHNGNSQSLRLSQGESTLVTSQSRDAFQIRPANAQSSASFRRQLEASFAYSLAVDQRKAIGLNFVSGRHHHSMLNVPNVLPRRTPAGVVPQFSWNNTTANQEDDGLYRGDNKNVASPASGVIVDNRGAPTNVKVKWTGFTTWSSNKAHPSPSGNNILLSDFLLTEASEGPDASVTLENLPYGSYDVYVYFAGMVGESDSTGTVTLNGATAVEVASSEFNSGPFDEAIGNGDAGHYVRFANVSGSSVTIGLNAHGDRTHMGIYGVQIVKAANPTDEL